MSSRRGNGPGEAPGDGAGEVRTLLADALGMGERGDWEGMARHLRSALDENPEDPYILGWLGVAEQELGNDGAAYDYFRACLAEDPIDPHLLALAGAGLAAFDDPDAEAALRAAALTGPDVTVARLQYGAFLARSGLFEEALEHLRAARELSPDDPMVRGELGGALALKGDLEAAADELEGALDLAPDDEWTRVLLGLVHVEAGRLEDAAQELVRATEQGAEDAEANALAALAAAAVGWEDAAYAALARAEQAATGADVRLAQEAEERVTAGPDAARRFLLEALAPSALRERLSQPL